MMSPLPLPEPPLAAWVWLAQMIVYHGVGLCFEWLDRTHGLARFKVKPKDRLSYFQVLPRVLANQIFLLLPAMLGLQWLGLGFVGSSDVTMLSCALTVACMTVGHDVVQYVAHRFVLHRPDMMRRLGHAVHHSTIGSVSISACYMSGADFFLEIVCPYLLPLALIGGGGSNFAFHAAMAGAGAIGGLYEHSGYDFSLALREKGGRFNATLAQILTTAAHAAHHARGNVSFSDGFGSSNICDTIFRTRFDLVPQRERRTPSSVITS